MIIFNGTERNKNKASSKLEKTNSVEDSGG